MEKKYIILTGRRNVGKSSLINRLTGQETAIVSDTAGTTTDPVKKAYEIPGYALYRRQVLRYLQNQQVERIDYLLLCPMGLSFQ